MTHEDSAGFGAGSGPPTWRSWLRAIAEGKQHIARQEMLLTSLRTRAAPAEAAEKLLVLLNSTQVEHRAHHGVIAAALEADGH